MNKGLFNREEFRDNCGFGLMAHMQGTPSHDLLEKAIESLTCMTHRGGIAADGKTGDGCGLLIQKPDAFLRAEARRLFNVNVGSRYAVGMVFLSQDDNVAAQGQQTLTQTLTDQGLQVIGWRDVPVNVDGTELEKLEGRNLMPRLHAGYSAGTLIGSGADARVLSSAPCNLPW